MNFVLVGGTTCCKPTKESTTAFPDKSQETMVFSGRQKLTNFCHETEARKVMVDFRFDALYG